MKGLFVWVGYKQAAIQYDRDPRFAGQTKWSYWKLWNFALEGITSFTIVPLKISSYLGIFVAFISMIYAVVVIFKTLIFGEPVQGWPTLIVVILFLGGVQLISLGVIGEYLGRIFNEVKNRPLYFINTFEPSIFSTKEISNDRANHEKRH
jgi:glycosyltransferase involved in cell wall biosynthesis